MVRADACNCAVRCPHGDRCLGGHAWPDEHWYPCTKCTPATKFEDLPASIQRRLKRAKRGPKQ